MEEKVYERLKRGDRPVLAICYDFDKTLSPIDMQAQGYIQSIGYDVGDFWRESNGLAEKNDMDQNLAYMYTMIEKAKGKFYPTKDRLSQYGANVTLFPGVNQWFERINQYGRKKGVEVEHYIISSGLKEMIEGTAIAQKGVFKRIYASSYYYDENGIPAWPAQIVNYTNKTQFLFRIEKGTLEVNDQQVNVFFPEDEIRIPFRNIVYIGDSDTDVPCMTVVTSRGGHSIGVYNSELMDKDNVFKMIREGRISFFAAADYCDGSELDCLVKQIIDRTASNEILVDVHNKNEKEVVEHDEKMMFDKITKNKANLVMALYNSNSFANTHTVIERLNRVDNWSEKEMEQLFEVAIRNDQVRLIIQDFDIKTFYEKLIDDYHGTSECAIIISSIIKNE